MNWIIRQIKLIVFFPFIAVYCLTTNHPGDKLMWIAPLKDVRRVELSPFETFYEIVAWSLNFKNKGKNHFA